MLLKPANRWRSRSNTIKDIYISLSSEFIVDVKLLFRFLISWLVLESLPKDWTPMSKFSVFWGVFRPSWPSQKKIYLNAETKNKKSVNNSCIQFALLSAKQMISDIFIRYFTKLIQIFRIAQRAARSLCFSAVSFFFIQPNYLGICRTDFNQIFTIISKTEIIRW